MLEYQPYWCDTCYWLGVYSWWHAWYMGTNISQAEHVDSKTKPLNRGAFRTTSASGLTYHGHSITHRRCVSLLLELYLDSRQCALAQLVESLGHSAGSDSPRVAS